MGALVAVKEDSVGGDSGVDEGVGDSPRAPFNNWEIPT
jgi:hypothetical protein